MVAHRLRVYYGPGDYSPQTEPPQAPPRKTVTAPLSEILPLLADAFRNGRTWLGDFQDDHVTLSSDLYQTLKAYQHYKRTGA